MIKLTVQEWNNLRHKLMQVYPVSWIAISWVSKRELGFTVRDHHDHNGTTVYLDFYDDGKEAWFRLKHL